MDKILTANNTLEDIIPKGGQCTGCPCSLLIPNPNKMHMWGYGCSLIHNMCKSGGEYDNYGIKHKNCPSLRR